jgi:hypothetical protein
VLLSVILSLSKDLPRASPSVILSLSKDLPRASPSVILSLSKSLPRACRRDLTHCPVSEILRQAQDDRRSALGDRRGARWVIGKQLRMTAREVRVFMTGHENQVTPITKRSQQGKRDMRLGELRTPCLTSCLRDSSEAGGEFSC